MKNDKIIIGICGLIGSGKDTVADYLVNTHGFRRLSFAGVLKDAVSVIFGWDRELLEGKTAESREWREQVDTWWANRLGMKHLTPRWVLQYVGTEVFRKAFHDDMWIASIEHKLMTISDNVVISDVRFPNEINSIKTSSGLVIRTKRGPDPIWYQDALHLNVNFANTRENSLIRSQAYDKLKQHNVHASETSWIGSDFDKVLSNDGSIDDLYSQIGELLDEFLIRN